MLEGTGELEGALKESDVVMDAIFGTSIPYKHRLNTAGCGTSGQWGKAIVQMSILE